MPNPCTLFLQHEINHFGIDYDGPLPNQAWSRDSVVGDALKVPDVHLSIPSNQIDHHLMQFNPLADSQSFEIDIYLQVVDCSCSFLP